MKICSEFGFIHQDLGTVQETGCRLVPIGSAMRAVHVVTPPDNGDDQ